MAQGRAPGPRHRAPAPGRHRRCRAAARRLPAPAVGRHEPARDDRHGDRLQPEAPHRRRADHRARRHHPGADPRPAAQAAARDRHGPRPHHPRHGRGRRDGASASRSIMPGRRWRSRRSRASSPTRIIPTPPRCWRPCRSAPMAAACPRFRAWCPASSTGPTGCLFSPRCRYATEYCRRVEPHAGSSRARRCAVPLSAGRRRAARPSRTRGRRMSEPPVAHRHRASAPLPAVARPVRARRRPEGARRRQLHAVTAASTLAVVGESGCGKSHPRPHRHHDRAADRRARSRIDGNEVTTASADTAARRCAARCRSCSRTPTARSIPRQKIGDVARGAAARQHRAAGRRAPRARSRR